MCSLGAAFEVWRNAQRAARAARPARPLRAHSSSLSHQAPPRHPQIAEREQRDDLCRVLREPAVVRPEQRQNPRRCWLSGRLPMVRVAGLRPNTPRFLANCIEVADGAEAMTR